MVFELQHEEDMIHRMVVEVLPGGVGCHYCSKWCLYVAEEPEWDPFSFDDVCYVATYNRVQATDSAQTMLCCGFSKTFESPHYHGNHVLC